MALRGIVSSSGGGGDLTALTARVTTLESVQYEYEVYSSVASGTGATLTFPTGTSLVAGEYGGQNAIVTKVDGSGRPIDQAAKTAAGAVITATLTTGGVYTLSGTPSAYPVALVYQLRVLAKDAANVPLASIIDATQLEGTMAKQDADAVAITGGTIGGITSLGVGTASPEAAADIVGTILISANKTDATNKTGRLRFKHYTNAEEHVTGMIVSAGATGSTMYIGGGSVAENAVTDIKFHTAANSTTLTGTQVATLDSAGRFGLGTTPSTWGTSYSVVDLGVGSALANTGSTTTTELVSNAYLDTSAAWIYKNTAASARYSMTGGQHRWHIAASGTAGAAVTFTQAMTLDGSGNLGIGTISPAYRLDLRGSVGVGAQVFETSSGTSKRLILTQEADAVTYNATYGTGSNAHAWQVGNVERMRLDLAGNLGVGTSSPGTKLDVQGTSTDARVFATNAGGKARMFVRGDTANMSYESDGSAQTSMLFDNVNGQVAYSYGLGASGNWRFFTAGSERVKIDNVGNVGIGTSSAVYPLVVSKAGAQGLEFSPDAGASASPLIQSYNRSGAAYLQMNFDGLQYVWRTSGTERMRLDSSGNLGIGVVAPTSKIAAAGVIESTSGGFKFPDGTTQTTAATGGGGGGVSLLQAVVTVATAAYYETIKTVTVAGVSSTSKVLANLAPNEDWDVDDLTGYDVIATPGSGTIDFMITAPGPIVGTFNINYLWS